MSLDELRKEIDAADKTILEAIEKRMDVARRIGEDKRLMGRPIYDVAREADKLDSLEAEAGAESRPYIRELYGKIFELTRRHEDKKIFGVLGQKLPHTYSPEIHHMLTDSYTYGIIEREPDELDELFNRKIYGGFNVTIPYKKEAYRRCDVLSEEASATGAVNTVVFAPDGKTYGYNTDVYGFSFMLKSAAIEVAGRKCLVLGHGGAAGAVGYALEKMRASSVTFCSRREDINYDNVYDICSDAQVIVNCTPVGMYPEVEGEVIDLSRFTSAEAFADLIYNPSSTKLMQKAEALGLKTAGGLTMLVAQAYKASLYFRGAEHADDALEETQKIRTIVTSLEKKMKNITLIGMPGCGKTTLGKAIARATGKMFIDLDVAFLEEYGIKPSECIANEGEEAFRAKESLLAAKILPQSGKVISCGGGIVTREVNRFFVRCNSRVIYLRRPLEVLAGEDRPITAREGVNNLYEQRRGSYESWCDTVLNIPSCKDKAAFLEASLERLYAEDFL